MKYFTCKKKHVLLHLSLQHCNRYKCTKLKQVKTLVDLVIWQQCVRLSTEEV